MTLREKITAWRPVIIITVLTAVFGGAYYFVTQAVDPAWFGQFDKFYTSFAPFLAFIIGQWIFHSQVNKPREKENASG